MQRNKLCNGICEYISNYVISSLISSGSFQSLFTDLLFSHITQVVLKDFGFFSLQIYLVKLESQPGARMSLSFHVGNVRMHAPVSAYDYLP